ncbi:MAG: hypothetical protein ACK587_08435 [Cyanobacteriota bacterium]|jgi:hypothetical protein
MTSSFLRSVLLGALLALPSAATAGVIFSDDFSANTPSLDNPVPFGWQITNGGSVDILGNCGSVVLDDLLPGNNCYVDLDGNADPTSPTAKNGLLTKSLFLPVGHTYTAYFSLARNDEDPFGNTVYVKFGTSQAEFYLENDNDPSKSGFKPYSITFVPISSGTYDLSFLNSNIDDYGGLLDNVSVNQVPVPLPAVGTVAAFGLSRRLRARLRQSRR